MLLKLTAVAGEQTKHANTQMMGWGSKEGRSSYTELVMGE